MEKSTKITYRIFHFATILLLASGFGMSKIWLGVIIILIMVPYWWITRRLQRKIYSGVSLVIFVGIAAYGLLSNASSYLMVAGVATALACWELEDQIPNAMKSSISLNTRLYEKNHLKKIGITITTGFIVAEAGLFLKLSLPFGAVFLVAILVLFCIFQLFLLFKRT
ncbi:MAG: hypothetical protein AB9907_08910 [Flexilinea sp.]